MSTLPIADYALLSDCHSAALVSRAGSVDWLCFPRFDGPSVFARLLDEDAGHWYVRPSDVHDVERRYLEGAMVLQTTFSTPSGTVVLEDAMAVGRKERGHELGMDAPHALLRRARCTEGRVEMESGYAPRPEYGSESEATRLLLSAPEGCEPGFTLRAGESACFALQFDTESAPRPWNQNEIAARLDDTAAAWRSWSEIHQSYQGPWRDQVHHGGRVLQALTYAPTGAMVAAPTTSLPEAVGGGRNWDYRYTWVRDASFTLDALWIAACPDEAQTFFDFLAEAGGEGREGEPDLQIVYGVGGERDLSERELPHLSGWRGNRPVRVGNGAFEQLQLDVYGELLAAAHRLRDQLDDLGDDTRSFLVHLADTAAARWREKDHGIWEIRHEPRDFLYSKLMCWVALDRAIDMADFLDAGDRTTDWKTDRDEIRGAILDRGWSERAGAFTQAFGTDDLDASSLMIPIVGFLPATDSRVRATIEATVERLTDARGLVFRYRAHDGVEGDEGTFLLCTFWLAEALALAGEVERARETFERAAAFANDVGLLAEEVDAKTGELLGNFPQAFSHAGLINAASAISKAEAGLVGRVR